MSIDEAIEDLKRIVNYEARNGYDRFAEFLSQIIKWLEELKELKEQKAETQCEKQADFVFMVDKAIDDFKCYVVHEEANGNIKSLDDYDIKDGGNNDD